MARARDLVLKTDYSGYFSVSFRRLPKLDSVGLAVSSSGTSGVALNPKTTNSNPETADPNPKATNSNPETTKPKRTLAPRGSRGLSSYAKRLLVGSVNLLEQRHGRRNLVFHTATLPTDDPALKIEALRKSKQILKYWRKVLARLLERVGLPREDLVVVLELQKRGAVHFHTVFVNHYRRGRYVLSLGQLDKAWKQALTAVVPALKTADFSKSCRTERVRKSAGRYLA